MKRLLLAALLFGTSFTQADPLTDDLHCYISTLSLVSSSDPKVQVAGMMAHSYWLGRLDGRAPDLDLESRVIAEMPFLQNSERLRAEMIRCGGEMAARGKAEKDMGDDMQKRGAEMQKLQDSR